MAKRSKPGETPGKKKCGAKTNAGTPCANKPLPNGRCRLHGGLSPGAPLGNQNARKFGIYSEGLTQEESLLWDDIQIGNVDTELKLCRVRLRRALIAEKEARETRTNAQAMAASSSLEISEIKQTTSANGRRGIDVTRKLPDFRQIIDRTLARIQHLEKLKAELEIFGGGADPLDVAEKIKDSVLSMMDLELGTNYVDESSNGDPDTAMDAA